MTSRNKTVAWALGIASVALFTGYATFDQWSAFVGGLLRGFLA